jgi:hypothetical protein
MVCHFCLEPAKYREDNGYITFCGQYCQIAYHVVNPLEHKDTIFSTLLQIPPSELFRLTRVSRKFRNVIQLDNSFKVAYVTKWGITDEFYMNAKYRYHNWLPFLDAYHGYFDRMGTMDEIFTASVMQDRLDITQLMINNLPIQHDTIRWCITYCIQRDHPMDLLYLIEFFKYVPPTNEDLEEAVTGQLSVVMIKYILDTRAITNVENAIRWAGIHGNQEIMQLLLTYKETGVSKKQKK